MSKSRPVGRMIYGRPTYKRPGKAHPPAPVIKSVTVPFGRIWTCFECKEKLPAGTECYRIGGNVYCKRHEKAWREGSGDSRKTV